MNKPADKVQHSTKIPIGISSCLLGDNVRYNGGNELNSYIQQTLGKYFEFQRFCPEMAIGLGVPRKPIRLVHFKGEDVTRCIGADEPDREFTAALQNIAHEQHAWQQQLCGYIFKRGSPSCGMARVKVWQNNRQPQATGRGIYAATVMENFPHLPVEEEGRLGDATLRENFIQRVLVLHRWKQLEATGLTVAAVGEFHARHKLILMSHQQQKARELGRLVAGITRGNLQQRSSEYLSAVMTLMSRPATVKNHINVLQHIQGYLKKALGSDDKQELVQSITAYRLGQVPLIVPITLLNHHFRHHPDTYIANSWYMRPTLLI